MRVAKAERHPDVQEDRPQPRAVLPFKIIRDVNMGQPCLILEYEADMPLPLVNETRRMPFKQDVRVGGWGRCVVQLMEQYWALEARVDGLVKERDEAVQARVLLEGQVKSLTARLTELDRRFKKEKE